MGGRDTTGFRPDAERADAYDALYAEYRLLHDYFGRGANEVMHRLRAIRNRAVRPHSEVAGPDAGAEALAVAR
jgi:L-ribulokinase